MIFVFFEKNEQSITQYNFPNFQIHNSINDEKIQNYSYFLYDFDEK